MFTINLIFVLCLQLLNTLSDLFHFFFSGFHISGFAIECTYLLYISEGYSLASTTFLFKLISKLMFNISQLCINCVAKRYCINCSLYFNIHILSSCVFYNQVLQQ